MSTTKSHLIKCTSMTMPQWHIHLQNLYCRSCLSKAKHSRWSLFRLKWIVPLTFKLSGFQYVSLCVCVCRIICKNAHPPLDHPPLFFLFCLETFLFASCAQQTSKSNNTETQKEQEANKRYQFKHEWNTIYTLAFWAASKSESWPWKKLLLDFRHKPVKPKHGNILQNI